MYVCVGGGGGDDLIGLKKPFMKIDGCDDNFVWGVMHWCDFYFHRRRWSSQEESRSL